MSFLTAHQVKLNVKQRTASVRMPHFFVRNEDGSHKPHIEDVDLDCLIPEYPTVRLPHQLAVGTPVRIWTLDAWWKGVTIPDGRGGLMVFWLGLVELGVDAPAPFLRDNTQTEGQARLDLTFVESGAVKPYKLTKHECRAAGISFGAAMEVYADIKKYLVEMLNGSDDEEEEEQAAVVAPPAPVAAKQPKAASATKAAPVAPVSAAAKAVLLAPAAKATRASNAANVVAPPSPAPSVAELVALAVAARKKDANKAAEQAAASAAASDAASAETVAAKLAFEQAAAAAAATAEQQAEQLELERAAAMNAAASVAGVSDAEGAASSLIDEFTDTETYVSLEELGLVQGEIEFLDVGLKEPINMALVPYKSVGEFVNVFVKAAAKAVIINLPWYGEQVEEKQLEEKKVVAVKRKASGVRKMSKSARFS